MTVDMVNSFDLIDFDTDDALNVKQRKRKGEETNADVISLITIGFHHGCFQNCCLVLDEIHLISDINEKVILNHL